MERSGKVYVVTDEEEYEKSTEVLGVFNKLDLAKSFSLKYCDIYHELNEIVQEKEGNYEFSWKCGTNHIVIMSYDMNDVSWL